jgi:hypothetical protein
MKKTKKGISKKILIIVGIIILSISWIVFYTKIIVPYFTYSFTNKMPPEIQKKFRNEYLKPLCQKLAKSPVQFDEGLTKTEKEYWMATRFSILTKFKNCDEFAAYPELRHDVEEFAIHWDYIAKYDFGPGKTYEIEIYEKESENKMEFRDLRGLNDTLICYGENLSLPYVQKWHPPAKVNREEFFKNLNSQCTLSPR